MKERDIINNILGKYDLLLPMKWSEKRKIAAAKKRTLVAILARNQGGAVKLSWSLSFYSLLKRLGLGISPASGARMGFAAAAICILISAGGVLTLLENYGLNTTSSQIAESDSLPEQRVKIFSGHSEISGPDGKTALNKGMRIITGRVLTTEENAAVLFSIEDRAAVSLLEKGSVKIVQSERTSTVMELSGGSILSKVSSPLKGSYEIVTSDASARVTGTVFAVSIEGRQTSVSVLEGTVEVTHKISGAHCSVESGNSVLAGEKMNPLPLTEKERALLEKFMKIEAPSESEGKDLSLKLNELNRLKPGKEKRASLKTIEDIKKKYGRVDRVVLYSGKVYTGAIISRGASFRIITARGIRTVPAKNIKNTVIVR